MAPFSSAAALKQEGPRYEVGQHGERPWGKWITTNVIYSDDDRCIECHKDITVNAGQQLSLQSHNGREEYWVVAQGVATVMLGPDKDNLTRHTLGAGEEIFIPVGFVHRLENHTKEAVVVKEIQKAVGYKTECDEADIIRYQDVYGRLSSVSSAN